MNDKYEYDPKTATPLERVAFAFAVLGALLAKNGRRRDRLEMLSKMRIHRPEAVNAARTAPMGKRSERRARIKELRKLARVAQPEATKSEIDSRIAFRPVLGYIGPAGLPRRQFVSKSETE